jgi:hypothetical protein
MEGGTSALSALSAMTAPAALVGACGLLLLGIYNKYSHIVASLRRLNGERRAAGAAAAAPRPAPDAMREPGALRQRIEQIDHECSLLLRRLRSVLFQILSVAGAMILFLSGSISLGALALLHLPLGGLAVGLVLAGVASLIVAMVLAATEARFIWDVVNAELKWPEEASEDTRVYRDEQRRSSQALRNDQA